jgi:protein-disulfide isomerase
MNKITTIIIICLFLFSCSNKKAQNTKPVSKKKINTNVKVKKTVKKPKRDDLCKKVIDSHLGCILPKKQIINIPQGNSPFFGTKNPLATIVLFTDPLTPTGENLNLKLIPEILKKYKDFVKIIYKHQTIPYHPVFSLTSEAALEIRKQKGDKVFLEFLKLVSKNRSKFFINSETYQGKERKNIYNNFVKKCENPIFGNKAKMFKFCSNKYKDCSGFTKCLTKYLSGKGEVGKLKIPKMSCKKIAKKHFDCIFKKQVFNIPAGNSPAKGAKKPLVTIFEFSDYQCPYCFKIHVQLAELVKKFPKDLKIVFKHTPLPYHKLAKLISKISVEIQKQKGDKAFWKFSDEVFANQDSLNTNFIMGLVKDLGIDIKKFETGLRSPENEEKINKDLILGNIIGVKATPTLYINGVLLEDPSLLLQTVKHEISQGKKLLKKKIKRKDIYAYHTGFAKKLIFKFAKKLGVNLKKLKVALNKNSHLELIKSDLILSKKIGFSNLVTTVLINGALIKDNLMENLDDYVKKGKFLIEKGMKKEDVYKNIMKKHTKLVNEIVLDEKEKKLKAKIFLKQCSKPGSNNKHIMKAFIDCSKNKIECKAFHKCVMDKIKPVQ